MDLRVFLSVLDRHKRLVVSGFVAALLLAFLSVARITSAGISYRQKEQWVTHEIVLVTQLGFPVGRIIINTPVTIPGAATQGQQFADSNRFNNLAILYARLATSDAVRAMMLKDGPIPHGEAVQAQPVIQAASGTPLPLIDIAGIGYTPSDSIKITRRTASALSAYIVQEQRANHVSLGNRVVLSVVEEADVRTALHNDATAPQMLKGHEKTRPILVFLGLLVLTIGLAFLVENLKRGVSEEPLGDVSFRSLNRGGDVADQAADPRAAPALAVSQPKPSRARSDPPE